MLYSAVKCSVLGFAEAVCVSLAQADGEDGEDGEPFRNSPPGGATGPACGACAGTGCVIMWFRVVL